MESEKTLEFSEQIYATAKYCDWLRDDHLVFCVRGVEGGLGEIEWVYEEEEGGQRPYHARIMRKVLIYGLVGVFSSGRSECLVEDVVF